MVQKMDAKGQASPLFLNVSSNASFKSQCRSRPLPATEDSCVVEAINNAMSFHKVDCESIEELLKYCRKASARRTENPNLLGVNELEVCTKSPSGKRIPRMPQLRSPGVIYDNKYQARSAHTRFPFETEARPNKRGHTKRRTQRTSTAPILGKAAKSSFLLGAFSKDYTVGSVTSSLLKEADTDQGAMFMETYTVVILGELSVGKSALCKKFFRSGMKPEASAAFDPKQNLHDPFDDDEDFMSPSIRLDGDSYEESPRSDSHHIYERPVTVNGECSRMRILDINAEKHRMECENYGDFEPYLQTGDAYVIAYAVTDRGTFKTVAEILSRMSTHHSHRMSTLPVILVGNKCDLVRRRQVATTDGIRLAAKYNAKFIETSASLNQNVTKLFEGVIQQIRLRNLCMDVSKCKLTDAGRKENATGSEYSVANKQSLLVKSDSTSQASVDSLSITDEDSGQFQRSRSFQHRRHSSDEIDVADGAESPKEKFEPSTSRLEREKSYKKRASRCLMKILHRRDKSEKTRKSKSCQDLSVL